MKRLQRARGDGGKLTGKVLSGIVDAAAKAAKFRQMARRLGAAREQTVRSATA
jgi:phosphoserine phosphatase